MKFESFILISAKIKTLWKQERNIDFNSETKQYLQNRCIINNKELTFKKIRKIQLCSLYLVLICITHNVVSIFDSDAKIEKLFNHKRDIIYYRKNRFHVSTIEALMLFRLHTKDKHIVVLLNDIINRNRNLNNNSDTKTKTNDQRGKRIYVEAILFSSFEFFFVEIEKFADFENQKTEIDYLSENNRVLKSENKS